MENTSFMTLHAINNQATPNNMIKYNTALQLYKIYNDYSMLSLEWQQMFFVQNFNEHNQMANVYDPSKYKIGKNLITNGLIITNN